MLREVLIYIKTSYGDGMRCSLASYIGARSLFRCFMAVCELQHVLLASCLMGRFIFFNYICAIVMIGST